MKHYPSASMATNDMLQFIGWNGQLQMWKKISNRTAYFLPMYELMEGKLKSRRIQIYRTSSKMLKFINHTWVKMNISYSMKLQFLIWKCDLLIDNFIHIKFIYKIHSWHNHPCIISYFPSSAQQHFPSYSVSIPLSNLSALVLIHDALGLNMAPSMVIGMRLPTEQQFNQWWLRNC